MADKDSKADDGIKVPEETEKAIEKTRRHALLVQRVKNDLESNERYRKIFDKYNPISVKASIASFARRIANYIDEGDTYVRNEEYVAIRDAAEAHERLMEIQMKKLFDCECLWRAELAIYEGVEITGDFNYWRDHIEECPFISPIKDEEVEAYIDYVLGSDFEEYPEMSWTQLRWQADNGEEADITLPEWFLFYDSRFGTSSRTDLPNIRGKKEDFYLGLRYSEERKRCAEKNKNAPPPDNRPMIYDDDPGAMEQVVREMGDPKLMRYFRIVEECNGRYEDELDECISVLRTAEGRVPVEAAEDWRTAIRDAADKYKRERLAVRLRAAYEDHKFRVENRLPAEKRDEYETWDSIRKLEKKDILEGRVLNGEPADLNF